MAITASAWAAGLGAQVDALMVELRSEARASATPSDSPTRPVALVVSTMSVMQASQLRGAGSSRSVGDVGGQVAGVDDAGVDGVLEVVGAVGDAVGETDDLALRRGGRGT